MDQRLINEAVQQAVRRCLGTSEPLAALESFLGRLRVNGWGEVEMGHVENATKLMLAIIYEPESAENARHDEFKGDEVRPEDAQR